MSLLWFYYDIPFLAGYIARTSLYMYDIQYCVVNCIPNYPHMKEFYLFAVINTDILTTMLL